LIGKKITIHSRSDNATITEQKYPEVVDESFVIYAMNGRNAARNVRIVFEPSSISALFEHIQWGIGYRHGDVERAGMLIGKYYRDSSDGDGIIWADVIAVIPAEESLVTATFETISISATAWMKMRDIAAEYRTENLQILGWYHTHLDYVDTKFTEIDKRTQQISFDYEYSFGVVFNPNIERWSAYSGRDSQECCGALILDELLISKYGKPKITIRQINESTDAQAGPPTNIYPSEMNDSETTQAAASNTYDMPLGQLFGQFFNGIGAILTQYKSTPKRHQAKSSEKMNIMKSDQVQRDRTKKIIIRSNNYEGELRTAIKQQCLVLSSSNDLIDTTDASIRIYDDDIYRVLYQTKNNTRFTPEKENLFLDGNLEMKQDSVMSLELTDDNGNAWVILGICNKNNLLAVLEEIKRIKEEPPNIRYAVFIDNSNPQETCVVIIESHFGGIVT